MKKISQKTLEMTLHYGVYDGTKYRYRAMVHTKFVRDNEGNYQAKTFVRIQRMPIRYIGTAAMFDTNSWEDIVNIEAYNDD